MQRVDLQPRIWYDESHRNTENSWTSLTVLITRKVIIWFWSGQMQQRHLRTFERSGLTTYSYPENKIILLFFFSEEMIPCTNDQNSDQYANFLSKYQFDGTWSWYDTGSPGFLLSLCSRSHWCGDWGPFFTCGCWLRKKVDKTGDVGKGRLVEVTLVGDLSLDWDWLSFNYAS